MSCLVRFNGFNCCLTTKTVSLVDVKQTFNFSLLICPCKFNMDCIYDRVWQLEFFVYHEYAKAVN